MSAAKEIRLELPGELPEPMDPFEANVVLNAKDGYEVTEADQRMMETGHGQLFGQFLLDRDGVIRWTFTEVPEGGRRLFSKANSEELMSAASQVAA